MVKKKCEIACEIETAGADIKLGPTAVLEALHVPNRPPKRFGVGCFPISATAEILDRQDDLPWWNIAKEASAGWCSCWKGRKLKPGGGGGDETSKVSVEIQTTWQHDD